MRKDEGIPGLEVELYDPTIDASSVEEGSELNGNEENLLQEDLNNSEDVRPDNEATSTRDPINDVIVNKYQKSQSSFCPSKRDSTNDVIENKNQGISNSFPSESVKQQHIDGEHGESTLNDVVKVEARETVATEQEMSCCSTDLQKVLGYIHDAFDTIIIHGKNVSEIFEPYQPPVTLINSEFFCECFLS